MFKEKAHANDSFISPYVSKEWFIRNTDGQIVLATWEERFDNSLDKKEKEEEQKKLKSINAHKIKKRSTKCAIKEHLVVFLVITICILSMILLPVFWVLFFQVYKHLWDQE